MCPDGTCLQCLAVKATVSIAFIGITVGLVSQIARVF